MTKYKQKQEYERWVCKCGISRKINRNCPYCKETASKENKTKATKSRILRHLQ